MRYGFILSKSHGFAPNDYGYVRRTFREEATLSAEHELRNGERIWWVDGDAFTLAQAMELADEKSQELFGRDPKFLDEAVVLAQKKPEEVKDE